MNKKELIGKYKNLEGVWDAEGAEIARRIFLQDLEQLNEPQKPVVPQSVSDWIELCKKSTRSLQGAIHYAKGTDVERWLIPSDNQETFARAWLDGYEVEKEKRYTAKVKGVSENNTLVHDTTEECWFFEDDNNEDPIYVYHTRKELEEAGFGWVFDCDGIEVEEVEG